ARPGSVGSWRQPEPRGRGTTGAAHVVRPAAAPRGRPAGPGVGLAGAARLPDARLSLASPARREQGRSARAFLAGSPGGRGAPQFSSDPVLHSTRSPAGERAAHSSRGG